MGIISPMSLIGLMDPISPIGNIIRRPGIFAGLLFSAFTKKAKFYSPLHCFLTHSFCIIPSFP